MSQRARSGIAGLAVLAQLAVLYAPRAPAVETGGIPLDKVVHVLAFALPTLALAWAGVPGRWAIALMAVHAPLSEAVQHALLPQRSWEAGDVLADLVGVAVAALVLHRGPARDTPP